VTFTVVAVLYLVLASLSPGGRLRRSALVGIRTTATMANEPSWRRSQRAGWSENLVMVPPLLAGAVCAQTALAQDHLLPLVVVVCLLNLGVMAVATRTATAAARKDAPHPAGRPSLANTDPDSALTAVGARPQP